MSETKQLSAAVQSKLDSGDLPSITDLSRRANLSRVCLHDLLAGRTQTITFEAAAAIARETGISLDEIACVKSFSCS